MDRSLLVRRVAPVAVFAAVLGGVVALNLRHAPTLKALPLAASGGNTARDSASGAAAPAEAKMRAGYGGKVVIKDAQLQGLPDKGPVYPLGGADDADILALARALGIAGEVKSDDDGKYVGSGDRVLRVASYGGRPWYLGGARDGVVSSDGTVVATPVDATAAPATAAPGSSGSGSGSSGSSGSGSSGAGTPGSSTGQEPASPPPPAPEPAPCPSPAPGEKDACAVPPGQVCTAPAGADPKCEPTRPYTPPKPPPAPSDDDARKAAAPVFAALGLGGAPVTVYDGWGTTSVSVAPVVRGLPTSGYETRVEVDVDGDVVSGNGYLGAVGDGDDYPLLDPRESVARGGTAYDGGPVALGAPCDTTTGCPTPAPAPDREVSAIRLGLMFLPSYDSTKAFLVPAWLLSFDPGQGDSYEEAVLALPDRYLEPAPTVKPDQPDPNGTDPDGTKPGDTEPGSTEPGPAVDVPPDQGGGSSGSTGAPAKP